MPFTGNSVPPPFRFDIRVDNSRLRIEFFKSSHYMVVATFLSTEKYLEYYRTSWMKWCLPPRWGKAWHLHGTLRQGRFYSHSTTMRVCQEVRVYLYSLCPYTGYTSIRLLCWTSDTEVNSHSFFIAMQLSMWSIQFVTKMGLSNLNICWQHKRINPVSTFGHLGK